MIGQHSLLLYKFRYICLFNVIVRASFSRTTTPHPPSLLLLLLLLLLQHVLNIIPEGTTCQEL